MNLFEARDGSYEPGSEYHFDLDPRLVEGIFYKFDPPRRWTRPITLRHVTQSEEVGVTRELPRPTRKPGKSRYSTSVPSGLFPETPTQDESGREYALVGRRALGTEQLVAVREKTEDMLHGKAVVLERLDKRGVVPARIQAGELDSFAVAVFDAADSYAQVEIDPEVRLRLEEEYRLLPARPQKDVIFQGIVHVGQKPDGSDVTAFEYLPRDFFTDELVAQDVMVRQFRSAQTYMTEPQASYDYLTPFGRLLASSV